MEVRTFQRLQRPCVRGEIDHIKRDNSIAEPQTHRNLGVPTADYQHKEWELEVVIFLAQPL